ncbi:MAG: hypothetical protein ACPL3B_00760 [Fervidobacterium sp.]
MRSGRKENASTKRKTKSVLLKVRNLSNLKNAHHNIQKITTAG